MVNIDKKTIRHRGFILLVTMIVLVVLASLAAGLSVHLSVAKRRQQYMIEYQRSRYGVDSALKYIMTVLPNKNFSLTSDRLDVPDFSDLFWMNQAEYADFIADWSQTATDEQVEAVLKKGASLTESAPLSADKISSLFSSLFGGTGGSDVNEMSMGSYASQESLSVVELDPNDVVVPGPYGPLWPDVMEPIDLEIGPCQITITIEDENAKMPLSWFVTTSKEANKRAENAIKTFCEWMSWDQQDLLDLEAEIQMSMEQIHEKKAFQLNPSPVLIRTSVNRRTASSAASRTSRRRSRARPVTTSTARTQVTKQRPAVAHTTDFAKLFHSSLLDREFLARSLPDTGDRVENPLKYLSLWGAQRVNINTAPRQVLEAAFSLAMDSFDLPEFTQEVIDHRKEKPFKKIDELKELGGLDTETMNNLQNYLTTTSTFFLVHVTSRSGSATSSAVATVVKEGKNLQQLFILYE